MADDDNSPLDPRGDTPVGSTWPLGNTMNNPNDPLIDWASNLKQDDLAKFLQDPQGHAADMAARGIPPPTTEQIQAMHDHNDAMGTPSRSTRFDTQPASPLDQPPGPSNLPLTPPKGPASLTPQQQARRGIAEQQAAQQGGVTMSTFPHPGGTNPEDPGSVTKKIEEWAKPQGPQTQYHRPGEAGTVRPSNPAVPRPLTVPSMYPPPGSTDPNSPAFIGPMPTSDYFNPPKLEKPTSAEPPPGKTEVGGGANNKGGANRQSVAEKIGKNADITTEEGRQNVGDAIGTLGKAMQGVRAPEPLRPPQIGAPTAPHPLAANAPALAGLLGLAGGGRPSPPILRLLGRG